MSEADILEELQGNSLSPVGEDEDDKSEPVVPDARVCSLEEAKQHMTDSVID